MKYIHHTRAQNDIRYLSLALLVLFIACGKTLPQKRSGRAAVKRIPVIKPADAKRIPDYQINLKITAGSRYVASIVSPNDSGHLSASALGSLITDLPNGADVFNEPSNSFPKVVIEVDTNVTMLGLWNPITLFRQGRTDISVLIPTGVPLGGEVFITVPWELTDKPKLDVKPNPLWLIVTLADDGKLSLNKEPAGSLSNTAPLTEQLQKVFREREVNGILRPGTNEIEKSVMIVMPMSSRKFSDLIAIARAVWLPGSKPIELVMDDPLGEPLPFFDPDARKGLIDTPPIAPPPRKKP